MCVCVSADVAGEGNEDGGPQGLEWTGQRVRELQQQLRAAKAQYQELGGAMEDVEEEEEKCEREDKLKEYQRYKHDTFKPGRSSLGGYGARSLHS